jgi:hypothetical protein
METKRILKPGQPGTKKLLQRYGEKLLCVRYRYDAENKKRLKTVELIIQEMPRQQPKTNEYPMNSVMSIRVRYGEIELRRKVRAAGGRWNRNKKVWQLTYKEVLRLGLTDRIVK